jgi:hypothetical protein
MRYIKPYQIFESEPIRTVFTKEQLNWLDKCVNGSWKYNPSTGFVDVDGNFDCRRQDLRDFKGVKFGKVSGDFFCYNNQLTSLEGAPQSVGGNFDCENNQLTSLEGAPQSVGGNFFCYNNQLTSLEGAPQSVGGDFDCEGNHLTSLEGAPQSFKGSFICRGNPVSGSTLYAICGLMKSGMAYQKALEKRWPKMKNEDRALMYKQMTNLPPEETRKYNALANYNNIKGYL